MESRWSCLVGSRGSGPIMVQWYLKENRLWRAGGHGSSAPGDPTQSWSNGISRRIDFMEDRWSYLVGSRGSGLIIGRWYVKENRLWGGEVVMARRLPGIWSQ